MTSMFAVRKRGAVWAIYYGKRVVCSPYRTKQLATEDARGMSRLLKRDKKLREAFLEEYHAKTSTEEETGS